MADQGVLKTRTLTALALIVPVLGALAAGGVVLKVLCLVVFVGINYEYFSCFVSGRGSRSAYLTAISCLLPVGYLLSGLGGLGASLAAAVMLVFILFVLIVENEAHEHNYRDTLPAAITGLCYPGVLGALLVAAADMVSPQRILWLLFVVGLTDTAAYIGGSVIGGRKLAPRVSPKKTVSGTLCGLAAATAVGAGLSGPLGLGGDPLRMALYGLIAGVLAVFGDLSESLLKRAYGVKDTGGLLPGHGGLLDRLDALLFAAPVLFFLL